MPALTQACAHHPDRPGHARCMSCKKVVCQECTTLWDGVNHCRPCVARQAAASSRQRAPVWRWAVWAGSSVFLFLGAGWVLAWALSVWSKLR